MDSVFFILFAGSLISGIFYFNWDLLKEEFNED